MNSHRMKKQQAAKSRNLAAFAKSPLGKALGVVEPKQVRYPEPGEHPKIVRDYSRGINIDGSPFVNIAAKLGEQPKSFLAATGCERHKIENELVGKAYWAKRIEDIEFYMKRQPQGTRHNVDLNGKKINCILSKQGVLCLYIGGKRIRKDQLLSTVWGEKDDDAV